MSDALEKLRHELEIAQRALADREAHCARQEGEREAVAKDAENTRKQLEHAHQEWISALDAVEDPIFLHDKDYRVLRCNLAYQQCAGIPFKQIIGQPYYEVFPKSHAPLPNCRETLENELEKSDEEVLVDGKVYRSRGIAIKSEQGGYLYAIHTLEDITERKADETSLKVFRMLLDKSNDVIEVIDPATLRFIDVNETACRTLGYSRDELLSVDIRKIDTAISESQLKQLDEALQTDHTITFETLHRRKDGSTYPVEVSLSRVDIDKEYRIAIVRDITERKRAEQKMLEEKEFSDSLIRSLPDIFFMLDAQGNMVQWNDKLEELLGLSPEELSGLNGAIFFHEGDKPHVAREIEQVFATGSASVEARMVMLEGLRDYLLTGSRIETPNGPCLIGFGLDITERKHAEALLQRERDFSSDIVETAQVIILVLDPQGRIVNFNPFMESLSGYSLQEVKERDWFDTFLPEATREVTKKRFQQSIANTLTRGNVDAILTKDGRQLLVEWYDKTLKDEDGNVTGLLAVGLDVTKRKQVEAAVNKSRELLQSVVETAPVRIFWKDRELRFLGCNTLFALDAGYTRPEELIGKSDFDMGWKDQAELYRADDKTVLESNSPKLGIEEPQTTPSGDTIWLRTSKVPLHDEGERVIGIVGIYDDITERKRAEADLAEQLEELRRWYDTTQGREARILELKHEVNALLGEAGQPPRYPSAESPEPKEQ